MLQLMPCEVSMNHILNISTSHVNKPQEDLKLRFYLFLMFI